MAVLDWITPDAGRRLEEAGVALRAPRSGDFAEWAELRSRSRSFLQPWEPVWPQDDLTRASFRRRLSIYARDLDLAQGYAFFVFRAEDNRLVGGVNLRDVRRGVSQSGALGYWAGAPYARQGHTLAAVRAVVRFAFYDLGLNRVEAACVPDNVASAGLLAKAGFEPEGRAKSYLKINGVWRDHLLFGQVRPSGQTGG
jgi:ribosomal-protein-alanine N-acetyltransferase